MSYRLAKRTLDLLTSNTTSSNASKTSKPKSDTIKKGGKTYAQLEKDSVQKRAKRHVSKQQKREMQQLARAAKNLDYFVKSTQKSGREMDLMRELVQRRR